MTPATTTPEAEAIIDQALKLSAAEREAIMLRVRDSLDVPDDPEAVKEATRVELQRRWDAIQRGEVPTYTAEEAISYAREQLRRGRSQ